MHQFVPGDHWEYTLTGRTHTEHGEVSDVTGMATQSIAAATFNGQPCLSDTTLTQITRADGVEMNSKEVTYFVQPQEQQGAYIELGESSTLGDTNADVARGRSNDAPLSTETKVLKQPTLTQVGSWSPPANLNADLKYTDGSEEHLAVSTVLGPSTVTWRSAALGNCWTMSAKQWDAISGTGTDSREVMCPFIGQPVVSDIVMSGRNKARIEMHSELVSYQLAEQR